MQVQVLSETPITINKDMKANEILKEDVADLDLIHDAAQNIYRKMRNAGLNDNNARLKIANLLRNEANKMNYSK